MCDISDSRFLISISINHPQLNYSQTMIRTIILTLFCFLLALQSSLVAQSTEIDAEKLDRYFTALYENDRFMGSVAVLDGEEIVFEAAYGVIDEDGTNANSESVYRIGSITKATPLP